VLSPRPLADVLGGVFGLACGAGDIRQPRLERFAAQILFQRGGDGGFVLNHQLFQRLQLQLAPVHAAGATSGKGFAQALDGACDVGLRGCRGGRRGGFGGHGGCPS
jgi:hypothetical protein